MRAKLTYTVKRWSEGAQVVPLTALRAKHGDVVGDIVEEFAEMIGERRDQPTSQDIKRTLRKIVAEPKAVALDSLDGGTECLLLREAWTHYRAAVGPAVELKHLSSDALAHCAIRALDRASRGNGRHKTDDLAVDLVRLLLLVRGKALRTDDRYALITDALRACGQRHGDDTVKRLILKAGQVS